MPKNDSPNTIVLGGGLAGLSLARFLEADTLVVEAADIPGGLCRSYHRDGFVYDLGGHILFSKDQNLLEQIVGWLRPNAHRRRRNNQIHFGDRFVKYPFENGLAALDARDRYECLIGFLKRPDIKPKDLGQWCLARFGQGIAEKYLQPYNRKIWKRPLSELSLHWVERVPSPPLEDVVKSAVGIDTEGYTHQLHFHYPTSGGIQALTDRLAQETPLQTGYRVRRVVEDGAGWRISDGHDDMTAERIVSTIPVFDLLAALTGVPSRVQQAAEQLQFNSLIVVMIAVAHEGLSERTAIYIPDPDVLPHRVCFMNAFSKQNAPAGSSHLIAEITVPPGDPLLATDDGVLAEKLIQQLGDICGFSAPEVIAWEVKRVRYAYVVYDRDYLRNTKTVFDYLDARGIPTTGRFGRFTYINMDTCVAMSRDLARRLNAPSR